MNDPDVKLRLSKRAKHPHLKVTPWGIVELIWPKDLDQRYIPKLSVSQKQWIHDRLQSLRANYKDDESHRLPESVYFPSIHETWHIQFRQGKKQGIHQQDLSRKLTLTSPAEGHGALLIKWLKLYARQKLLPWLDDVSGECTLPFHSARIANQKTRWGSCSKTRVISLNCKLLFLEPELVRYLFIHELCHTQHMNHSKEYWSLVGHYEQDYKILDKQINEAHYKVPIWTYIY